MTEILEKDGGLLGAGMARIPMECFEKAAKNKGLERSLKVKVPEETYASLKKEIESIEKK